MTSGLAQQGLGSRQGGGYIAEQRVSFWAIGHNSVLKISVGIKLSLMEGQQPPAPLRDLTQQ